MKNIITEILGEYTPTIGASGEIVNNVATLDWSWIIGAVLFVITLYSFFRIIGMIIGGTTK